MLEELQRIINAERLAEAEQGRLAQLARKAGPVGRPLRVVLADALRALASYLDHDGVSVKRTERRLARVF
jgi:hypothetical protein